MNGSRPKITIIEARDLDNDWRPHTHLKQTMKLGQWEQLKDIARRRQRLLKMLANLDDEEQKLQEQIDAIIK